MLDLPDTKPVLERVLRPTAHLLHRLGGRPNVLTMTSVVSSTLAGALVLAFPTRVWPLLAMLTAMLARLVFNHIDGIIARECGMKTPLGGLLNELATPAEDMALYLPLAVRPEMPAALIVCAVMLSVLVEVAGLSSIAIGGSRRYDGPMSKVVRGTLFAALAIAAALRLAPTPWVPTALVLILILILLVVTACNRLSRALEETRS